MDQRFRLPQKNNYLEALSRLEAQEAKTTRLKTK